MVINYCNRCHRRLELVKPIKLQQHIVCAGCGVVLEVVWLYPVTLDFAQASRDDNNDQDQPGPAAGQAEEANPPS